MSEAISDSGAAAATHIEPSKQRHRRVNVRVPIRISTIDPEKDPHTGKLYFFTSEEYSANISRGGAFVATPESIDPGRRVLVEIDIPEGSSVQTLGRVVWKRLGVGKMDALSPNRPGIGIEFTGGRPESLNELDRYLAAASRRHPSAPGVSASNPLST